MKHFRLLGYNINYHVLAQRLQLHRNKQSQGNSPASLALINSRMKLSILIEFMSYQDRFLPRFSKHGTHTLSRLKTFNQLYNVEITNPRSRV